MEDAKKRENDLKNYFDKRMAFQQKKSNRALREQTAKYESELKNMKEQLCELEEEKQMLAKNLQQELKVKEKFTADERTQQETARHEDRDKCKALKMKLKKQAQVIKDLNQRSQHKSK